MGKIVTLKSGAELDMTMCDFEEGKRLLKAVTKEIYGINITSKEDYLNIFKNLISRAILSDDIESTLKPCLDKCTYKKIKLTNLTEVFQDETNRADYLIVLKEVLEYNLNPFFVNLISVLKDLEGKIKTSQNTKS